MGKKVPGLSAIVPYLSDLCSFAGGFFFLSDYFDLEMFNHVCFSGPF